MDNELWLAWCIRCARHLHPASLYCPACGEENLEQAPVSGIGTVVECTASPAGAVGRQRRPIVLAVVALREDPRVLLTTEITDCPPDEVAVGMEVEAILGTVCDAPSLTFRPRCDVVRPIGTAGRRATTRVSATRSKFEDQVAITGTGRSVFGVALTRSPAELAVEACRQAIADAGLGRGDIDAVSVSCGSVNDPYSRPASADIERALLLSTSTSCYRETPGPLGGLVDAMLAVASGTCQHVLCVTVSKGVGRADEREEVNGDSWGLPRGTVSPLNRAALSASRYLARYELGREALGWVAVAARRHAARNPDALYRTALSIDEYLAAEAVSTPLSLYDCDRPCDGAVAVVVSASTLAADLAQPAVWLDAVASPRVAPAQSHGANPMGAGLSGQSPATQLWSRASRTQEDVDFFSVDDGFTLTTLNWLEALDFCEPGDAAEFVAGGIRIGPDGVLPINPDGGRLAAGHPGGYGSLREAVLQLRGRAETRQIPSVRVAAVASGTPGWGNALLLTTES